MKESISVNCILEDPDQLLLQLNAHLNGSLIPKSSIQNWKSVAFMVGKNSRAVALEKDQIKCKGYTKLTLTDVDPSPTGRIKNAVHSLSRFMQHQMETTCLLRK